MVSFLRSQYGDVILDTPWEASSDSIDVVYTFPTITQLRTATEEELRANGFGYRAKFIVGTAKMLDDAAIRPPLGAKAEDEDASTRTSCDGETWLHTLRECEDKKLVTDALEKLPGIGPKVARCIALFSLRADAAIPVDTHVWQITEKYYANLLVDEICRAANDESGEAAAGKASGRSASMPKTLTPRVMELVETVFQRIFGDYAVRVDDEEMRTEAYTYICVTRSLRPLVSFS